MKRITRWILPLIPITALAQNTFDDQNGLLNIESVQINNQYYKAQMQYLDNLMFKVNRVEEIGAISTTDRFDPNTGILNLQHIANNGQYYQANFIYRGDLNFELMPPITQETTEGNNSGPVDFIVSDRLLTPSSGEDFCAENQMRPITIYTAKRRPDILPPNSIIWANIKDISGFSFGGHLHFDTSTFKTWRYGKVFHVVVCVTQNLGDGDDGNPSDFKPQQ